jgi:hypothetical protein
VHLVLYRHQSTGVNGLKVREQGSTWSFVRSFGLFSARRGDNFLTMLPEFPIVACRDPLLEPCSGDADSLLLNIRVKCLSFRAKPAHISGHLPAGEIQELRRAGLQIGKPYTGHSWCLLSWEAQYSINRDNLNCTGILLFLHR